MAFVKVICILLIVSGIVLYFFKRGGELMAWFIVMAGCTVVSGKLWPKWYFVLPLLLIPPLVYRIIKIFQQNSREKKQKTTDQILELEFLKWYSEYSLSNKKIFERTQVQASESDGRYLKKWSMLYSAVVLAATLLFVIPMRVFLWNDPAIRSIAYITGSVGIGIALLVWYYFARKKKAALKTVIRGVITRKSFFIGDNNETYEFRLSEETWVSVTDEEYSRFTFGDIVEVEWLEGLVYEGRKIKRIGSIVATQIMRS